MSRTKPTIRDVARRAGVSHQTVSRVLNGSRRVRSETRQAVEAAIAELGFRPNAIARSMARGHTRTLACLAPNLTDYTFASLVEGAQDAARQNGYFLLAASARDVAAFQSLYDALLASGRTEGVLVINPYADARHTVLTDQFPTVLAGARPRAEALSSVALDDVAVGRQATDHLLRLGHRRIAMLTGPLEEDCTQDRAQGYREALIAAGIGPDPLLTVGGDWTARSGAAAFARLAALPRALRPTAVFAHNDQIALGLLHAAREAGLQLPRDLSVVGVDDIPLTAFSAPPLTTWRQDFAAIGRRAAELLIHAVENEAAAHEHLLLPATLIERASAAPPAESAWSEEANATVALSA